MSSTHFFVCGINIGEIKFGNLPKKFEYLQTSQKFPTIQQFTCTLNLLFLQFKIFHLLQSTQKLSTQSLRVLHVEIFHDKHTCTKQLNLHEII